MTDGPPASGSYLEVPVAPSLVGEVLDGRYRITGKLGEGGMGEVYAAEHVHIEKKFAIKLLKPEIVSNAEAVQRFRQEARSSSSIGHRNIIAIDDFGQLPDGRIYMCMELLNGAALNDLIQKPMSADRLLNILIQTGHGLAAAHAKGIIHRDMKPENIFVTIGPSGEDIPKLLDFGIAKVSGNDGQNHLTRTGTIFGTPFYMAPEQALGNPVDARTDIYAMGVIMYECFAGSLPFQGESFMGILTQHITSEAEPVAQRAAKAGRGLPPGIADVITRCMQKNPAQRFSTMDELVSALVSIYRGVAGPGMSTYMEAFPHSSQATPSPSASYPLPPPTGALVVGQTGPAPIVGAANQSQPNIAPSGSFYGGAPLAAPKKKNTGLVVGLLAVVLVGGAIAAVVALGGGDKKKPAGGGGGSGAQQVATGSDRVVTPPPHTGSDTGSATTTAINPPTGSGATPGVGSATVTPAAPIEVIVEASTVVAAVYENDVKVGDAPMIAKITPGTPRTFVLKAKGYRDKALVVDGTQAKQMARLERIPSPTNPTTPTNPTNPTNPTTPTNPTNPNNQVPNNPTYPDNHYPDNHHQYPNNPNYPDNHQNPYDAPHPHPHLDCSNSIVDPRNKACQRQYCHNHGSDPACDLD